MSSTKGCRAGAVIPSGATAGTAVHLGGSQPIRSKARHSKPDSTRRLLGVLAGTLLFSMAATARPDPVNMQPFENQAPPRATSKPVLRVITLNAAHGRKTSFNQLMLSRNTVRRNVDTLASLLDQQDPHLVALQEADGPSRWSGGFDHVQAVAERARFPWRFRGDHAEGWLYRYGTALLSRLPLRGTESFRFDPTPPTPRKGFVIGEVAWPGPAAGLGVDVVSVHFDYLSSSARQRQYEQLAGELEARNRPVVVLGDFNSDWATADSPVRRLADRLGLHAWEPSAGSLATHADQRIDWILISPDMRFERYEVLPDIVSDHLAVVAELSRVESPTGT